MQKFNRNYLLRIQIGFSDEYLEIKPPISMEVAITRAYRSQVGDATIRLFNLNQTSRDQIRVDTFDNSTKRKVILYAGYGDNLSVIFAGFMAHAFSTREGVDFVTNITGFDGGYSVFNSESSIPYGANTEYKFIVNALVDDLVKAGLTKGYISNKITGKAPKGGSINGKTTDAIESIVGKNCLFIDNNTVNVLAIDETMPEEVSVPVIDASTGLMNTPILSNFHVSVDILFEPKYFIGQKIFLDSITASQERLGYDGQINSVGSKINGFYRVLGVKHRVMFSQTIAGNAMTTVDMQMWNFNS